VELIGRTSNLGHLCKQWADLRKRIAESQARPPLLAQDARRPRSKRFLTTENVADIVARYEAGETTQRIGTRYGISKTRIANVLCEQGVAIRSMRQQLSTQRVNPWRGLVLTTASRTQPSPQHFGARAFSCDDGREQRKTLGQNRTHSCASTPRTASWSRPP
jgi:hypothetical protein